MRAARDLHHGTPQAECLHALARALDGPFRIAVVGPPVPAGTALADGPAAGTPPYAVRRVDPGDPGEQADVWVLVVDGTGLGDRDLPAGVRPSQVLGVILGGGPDPGTARRRPGGGRAAALPARRDPLRRAGGRRA